MIRDKKLLREFENELLRREEGDPALNRRLISDLLASARRMGLFPPENPLEGIEVDIRLARLLNARRSA